MITVNGGPRRAGLQARSLSRLGQAAQEYAVRGIAVFPCAPADCQCEICGADRRTKGKHPLVRKGHKAATTDVAQIARWWRRWPNANIGCPLNTSEVVIDIDGDVGRRSLLDLQIQHGILPATAAVRTGRGDHHYFTLPPGVEVSCSAGSIAAGIDSRARGGYVIAPPSRHVSGLEYFWAVDCELAPLPDAWVTALLAASPCHRGYAPPSRPQLLLPERTGIGRSIPEGARNHTLASAAGSARRAGWGGSEIATALAGR